MFIHSAVIIYNTNEEDNQSAIMQTASSRRYWCANAVYIWWQWRNFFI